MNWNWASGAVRSLDVLGWVLVLAIWQTALLALGVWLAYRSRRWGSPQRRHTLAFGALVAAVCLVPATWGCLEYASVRDSATPLASAQQAPTRIQTEGASGASRQRPYASSGPSETVDIVHTAVVATTRWMGAAMPWLASIWVVIAALLGVRLVGGALLVRWTRLRAASLETGPVVESTREVAALVGVGRSVRVAESPDVDAPVTTGWRQPVILVPTQFQSGLSREQLASVLAHELEHIRLGDVWTATAQAAIESLLFFCPGVQWLSRKSREAREQRCDDAAVRACGDRRTYATALGVLAGRATSSWLPAAMGQHAPSIASRIRRVLKGDTVSVMNRAEAVGLAAAIVVIVMSGAVVAVASVGALRANDMLSAGQSPASALARGRVPVTIVPDQPGSPVRITRAAGDESHVFRLVHVRNASERHVASLTFVAVVEHSALFSDGQSHADARPAILVATGPVIVDLGPGESREVPLALLRVEDLMRWKQSWGYMSQATLGVVKATFAEGPDWQFLPPAGAMTDDEVFLRPRPHLSRALVGNVNTGSRSGTLCLDDRGLTYSEGAVVAIRGEDGAVARCTSGVWVELAKADRGPAAWISIEQDGTLRAGFQAARQAYWAGGPGAGVPAKSLTPDSRAMAYSFDVRSWMEGDRARVVVTAVLNGRGGPTTEVCSFFISAGERREVSETERFGAGPITIVASATEPGAVR